MHHTRGIPKYGEKQTIYHTAVPSAIQPKNITTTPILQDFVQNFVEPFPNPSLTTPWYAQSQTSDHAFVVEPLLGRVQRDNFNYQTSTSGKSEKTSG